MAAGYSLIAFVGLCLLHSTIASHSGEHWGYPDLDVTDQFPKWGGICDTGRRQSPIDLTVAGSLKGKYPDLNFHNYGKPLLSPSLVNNGHTVQLFQFSTQMTISGGPLLDEFVAQQIHLHWWAEHALDGFRYPLEAHIVHKNKRYPNMTEAAQHKDGIVVMAVMYYASNVPNSGIEKLLEYLEFIGGKDSVDKPISVEQKISVRELFPEVEKGYIYYEGSLTTPPCSEVVTWIVLLDTFPVTLEQVNAFKNIETQEGKKLPNNYRAFQRTNNRAIVVVNDMRSMALPSMSSSVLAVVGSMLLLCLRQRMQ